MADIKGLLKDIEEYNKKFAITENSSEAEKLRYRLMNGKKNKEEWLQLREDVRAFFKSDASEEDKRMLMGYTESSVSYTHLTLPTT